MEESTAVAIAEALERVAESLERLEKIAEDIRDGRAYVKAGTDKR